MQRMHETKINERQSIKIPLYSKEDTGAATIDEEIIRYENVSVVFDGTTIIEHFSLPVCKGDKVILSGPSGSGKSTLLKMAQGYARPDEGTVTYRTHESMPTLRGTSGRKPPTSHRIPTSGNPQPTGFDKILHGFSL